MAFYSEIPEPEEPPSKSRPHGCLILITAVVVIAMLGSALAGAIWLFLREQETPEVPIEEPIVLGVDTAEPVEDGEDSEEIAVVVPTELPTPVLAPENGVNRIVFIDGDGQIATISQDGTNLRVLTDGSAVYRFPAWSPDGEQIAAIGSSNIGATVVVMEDTAGADIEELYFGGRAAPIYLYWSPSSETVSFIANDPNGLALYLAPADGSSDSRLRTVGSPFYWQWTADSEQLLIHTGIGNPEARLELIEAGGDEDGKQIANPGYFRAPAISADGRLLAYAEEIENFDSQVVVADTVSGENQTEKHTGQTAMSFNPFNYQLAYISPDSSTAVESVGSLRVMDGESGEVLILDQEPVIAFFWSPDGRYIAAFVPEEAQGSNINAALTGAKTGTAGKANQQLSLPSLRLIIFDVEKNEGRSLLTFTPTLTFLTQFVPFFDQYALSHHLWSPTSDAVVLPILEDGRSQIYIIPTNGGQKRYLAPGSMAFWSHQ